MARIELFDVATATGDAAAYLGRNLKPGVQPNNHVRLYAHAPFLSRLFALFRAPMQAEGAGSVLSCYIKEMVVIKTSHVNGCAYCYAHNTAIGQAAGITHEQVLAIGSDDYMTSPHLSPRERAAVLWAEHVTKNTAKHFDDTEIFELTLICGLFNFTNRVHDSLKIDLDEPAQVEKVKATTRLDPDKLKASVQAVLDHWPTAFPEPNSDAAPARRAS